MKINMLPSLISLAMMASTAYATRATKVVTLPLIDASYGFLVNITIGTPPQSQLLMIDTGSSNDWVASVDYRSSDSTEDVGAAKSFGPSQAWSSSRFDSTKSLSFTELAPGALSIMYADMSEFEGDIIVEDMGLGLLKLQNVSIGMATKGDQDPVGIIGLGSPMRRSNGTSGARREMLETMIDEGVIDTPSFALWMGEKPSITFGGFDASKFRGALIPVPLQPNLTGSTDRYRVNMTSLAVSHPNGSSTQVSPESFNVNVVLDTGSEFSYLPQSLLNRLSESLKSLGAYNSTTVEDIYMAPCSIRNQSGGIDVGFLANTEDERARFQIRHRDVWDVAHDDSGNGAPIITDGVPQCVLRIYPTAEEDTIMLDTELMRSVYTVHHREEHVLGMAQALETPGEPDYRDIWGAEKFMQESRQRQEPTR